MYQRRLLKLDLDGLDQTKTHIPRNTIHSKSLSNAWRPMIAMMPKHFVIEDSLRMFGETRANSFNGWFSNAFEFGSLKP